MAIVFAENSKAPEHAFVSHRWESERSQETTSLVERCQPDSSESGQQRTHSVQSSSARATITSNIDPVTGKILVYAPGGAQLAAAAYPAGVTGDVVTMHIEYTK